MITKTTKVKKAPIIKVKEIKKTASKAVLVKNITTKKTTKKQPLVVVSGELCFWVNNGPALCSMKDLHQVLRTMKIEQFLYHTGQGRNDFSAWVGDVLGDKKCSSELLKAKNIKTALATVEKYLKTYKV
jgi:hypothetical protein